MQHFRAEDIEDFKAYCQNKIGRFRMSAEKWGVTVGYLLGVQQDSLEGSRAARAKAKFRYDTGSRQLIALATKTDAKERQVILEDDIYSTVILEHESIGHRGYRSTWKAINEKYYGISYDEVLYLLKFCRQPDCVLRRTQSNRHGAISPEPPQVVRSNSAHDLPQGLAATRKQAILGDLHHFRDQFNAAIVDAICKQDLPLLEDIPPSVLAMWRSSTVGVPRLVSSNSCWRYPLEDEKLWCAVMSTVKETRTKNEIWCFGQKERGTSPHQVTFQLLQPNRERPLCLLNLGLKKSDFQNSMKLPHELEGMLTYPTYLKPGFAINITPKWAFVDIHADNGHNGLTSAVLCEKLWVFYPPTDRNIREFASSTGTQGRLIRVGPKLEGGLLARQRKGQTIFIPAGALHAVLTLDATAGLVPGITFTAWETMRVPLRYAKHLAVEQPDHEQLADVLNCYLQHLDEALHSDHNPARASAVSIWISHQELLETVILPNSALRQRAAKIWQQFFRANPDYGKGGICPCGKDVQGTPFDVHMWESHLLYLIDGNNRGDS
ncbi:hypothetical protein GP486_002189 [Trichoglossum hirsutum]|uniref:JmjC domain-containing protein n=1 Tax=Trichoglossum hirsutum TaxID=265104 RepID=A0A9P8RSC9_9PEZI|nr:hypothetical protein GP486_002189 [Trichoglossum hirsutum]